MTVVTEVVIMTSFSKKHLNTLTTDQLSGQLFATLAMFFSTAAPIAAAKVFFALKEPMRGLKNQMGRGQNKYKIYTE